MDSPALPHNRQPEPRWPVMVAMAAVAGLYFALPESLTFGPTWAEPVLVMMLLLATTIAYQRRMYRWNEILGYTMLTVLTAAMVASLALLIAALPAHKETPKQLLISSGALWVTNVLVFASWYWRLDAGGPNARDRRGAHNDGAFLFPQMAMDPQARLLAGEEYWRPGYVDYLFIAFNTSTAFSPTDAPVLSRWAKLMMMVQSTISLATVVLLAARAVNIL